MGYFINMWRKVSHWIIRSNDSLTNTELTGTRASFQWLFWIFSLHRVVQIDSLISSVTLLGLLYQYVAQSESLNHSFKRFIKKIQSQLEQELHSSDSFESFHYTELFRLIHGSVRWLFLGYFINMWHKVSHWIIRSNDSLTNTELSGTRASFQWLFWIFSLHRVVQIDSLISSVTLLGLLYQYVAQSESLNHSFKRFIKKYK